MRLNRCVACRAPRSIASTACSYVAPEWPSDTTWPWAMQLADQIRCAVYLRRNRDDSDVGPRRFDLAQDVGAAELPFPFGPFVRQAKTVERLRAAVLRIDEVAFQMSRQHASAACGGAKPRLADRREHAAQRLGPARDRGRAERGDAEPGQTRRNPLDGAAGIQRVGSLDAMDMNVHESRHDRVVPEVEVNIADGSRRRVRSDVDDPIALDDDGCGAQHAIGQHDVCVGQKDHPAGLRRPSRFARAACGLRAAARRRRSRGRVSCPPARGACGASVRPAR